MTPARIPPPPGDDIPRPVPSPVPPPPPYELEATPFDEVPTKLERVCPGCLGSFQLLPPDVEPPASYAEAFQGQWVNGKQEPPRCRGSSDPFGWWFCREPIRDDHGQVLVALGARGYLEIPGKLGVQFFPERRVGQDMAAAHPDRRKA